MEIEFFDDRPVLFVNDTLLPKEKKPATEVLRRVVDFDVSLGAASDAILLSAAYIDFLEKTVQRLNKKIAKFIYHESHGEIEDLKSLLGVFK